MILSVNVCPFVIRYVFTFKFSLVLRHCLLCDCKSIWTVKKQCQLMPSHAQSSLICKATVKRRWWWYFSFKICQKIYYYMTINMNIMTSTISNWLSARHSSHRRHRTRRSAWVEGMVVSDQDPATDEVLGNIAPVEWVPWRGSFPLSSVMATGSGHRDTCSTCHRPHVLNAVTRFDSAFHDVVLHPSAGD